MEQSLAKLDAETETKDALKDNNSKGKASKFANLSKDGRRRSTFSKLFHEIQFRATKNALMNYHEAELLEQKGTYYSYTVKILTALSASGVIIAVLQRGNFLANTFGVVGLIGLPLSTIANFIEDSSISLIPSYKERAKMHIVAAAGWMNVAETARTERLLIQIDSQCDVQRLVEVYKELVAKKEDVSKLVFIPRETHKLFSENAEAVYLVMKKKDDAFAQFRALEKQHSFSATEGDQGDDVYF